MCQRLNNNACLKKKDQKYSKKYVKKKSEKQFEVSRLIVSQFILHPCLFFSTTHLHFISPLCPLSSRKNQDFKWHLDRDVARFGKAVYYGCRCNFLRFILSGYDFELFTNALFPDFRELYKGRERNKVGEVR